MSHRSAHRGFSRRGLGTLLALAAVAVLGAARPAAAGWSSSPIVNVPICTASGSQSFRNVVTDGVGGILIAWVDTRSDSTDLYMQRVDAAGNVRWATNGVLVCAGLRDQDSPFLTPDGVGGALVAWRDFRNGATGDVYAQRVDADGQTLWTPNGVPVCLAAGEQANPVVVTDGFEGALVVWEDWRLGVAVYGQRLDAMGVPRWPADGIRLSNASGAQFEPAAISDADHGVIVGWAQQSGTGFDIVAQRVNMLGELLWGAAGIPIVAETGDQLRPALASDGSGGALFAWEDRREGASAIYAHHLSTWGGLLLPVGGVRLCSSSADQLSATLTSDGVGGAIVAWHDMRSGDDIFAQRLSVAGARLWGNFGRGVCTAQGTQQFPHLRSDGNGGAIVTWEDARNGPSDIYAQRLGPTGTAMWLAGGLPVSSAAGNQYQPQIVADTDSIGIVVWVDQRTGGSDLYAQRVPFAVTLSAPGDGARTDARLAAPRPNPTRGESAIAFTLTRDGPITLTIHDAAGRRVRVLRRGDATAGTHVAAWDGRDESGRATPPGAYFVRLEAESLTRSARLVRLGR